DGFDGQVYCNAFSNTVSGNDLMSPRLMNDAYIAYTLLESIVATPGLVHKLRLTVLGIPGTNLRSTSVVGWPAFSLSSYSALGNQSTVPFYFHNGNHQYVASANWTNGTHTIRFGLDTLRKELNMFQELNQPSGAFSFSPGTTGLSGGPVQNQYNS